MAFAVGADVVRVVDVETLGSVAVGRCPGVCSLVVDGQGNMQLASAWDNRIRLWNHLQRETDEYGLEVQEPPQVVAWNSDQTQMVAGFRDGAVMMWNANTGRMLSQMKPARRYWDMYLVAANPDGTRAAFVADRLGVYNFRLTESLIEPTKKTTILSPSPGLITVRSWRPAQILVGCVCMKLSY